MTNRTVVLLNMYEAMHAALGPSDWWPGETPFEVCVGAVLTQNTNWKNVEKAIDNLKVRGLLQPEKLYALPVEDLAELIRPAGYFRMKAVRLKNLLSFLNEECRFNLEELAGQDMDELRKKLLAVNGIGPETADSILLYGLEKPSFVVDAYTKRIACRHGLAHEDIEYHELRELYMDVVPSEVAIYNEYHALLVRTGNRWCKKKKPECTGCPLEPFLEGSVVHE